MVCMMIFTWDIFFRETIQQCNNSNCIALICFHFFRSLRGNSFNGMLTFPEIYMEKGSHLIIEQNTRLSFSRAIRGGIIVLQNPIAFESELLIDGVDLVFPQEDEENPLIAESTLVVEKNCAILGTNPEIRAYGAIFIKTDASLINNVSALFNFSRGIPSSCPMLLLDGDLKNNGEMLFHFEKESIDIIGEGSIINEGNFVLSCEDSCEFRFGSDVIGSGRVVIGRDTIVKFSLLDTKELDVMGTVTVENWKDHDGSIIVHDENAILSFSSLADILVERMDLSGGKRTNDNK